MNLMEQLDRAMWVRHDDDSGIIMAWFGGHGVHAYDESGLEVAFWNVGDFSKMDADFPDVAHSMTERIEEQDYADFS